MVKTPPPSGRSNNHWTGLAVPRGSPRTTRAANDTIVLGALPLALFLHGHGYFVQKRALQPQSPSGLNSMISSARPYAVHATYTLDDHEGLAKAQRFREGGLWRVDPDDYYEGTYLAYNASTPPKLQAAIDEYVGGNGGTKAAASIGLHVAALSEYVAELRDALALARALKRTLILPRWTCYCDRLWSGSDDIFHFGCMYPGAQDAKFVPFVCPMDHVLSPTEWEKAGVEHRDAAFIDRLYERAAAHSASPPSIVEVMVGGKANGHAHLPLGVSDQHAAMVLQPYASAKVIRLSSAHGLLCGIEGAENAASFDKLVRWPTTGLLQPPPWCSTCYQRCDVELTRWLSAAQIARASPTIQSDGVRIGTGQRRCRTRRRAAWGPRSVERAYFTPQNTTICHVTSSDFPRPLSYPTHTATDNPTNLHIVTSSHLTVSTPKSCPSRSAARW